MTVKTATPRNIRIAPLILALTISLLLTTAVTSFRKVQLPSQKLDAKQLLVVLSDNWNGVKAELYAFSFHDGKWIREFHNPVVLGRNGMGTGDGIININFGDAPAKREGDDKSPAGIFSIGTAFGYAPKEDVTWMRNPYIMTFDTLICIDDIHSPDYNRLVDKDSVKTTYNSFEYMHRLDDYYKWGIFINHNAEKTTPGDGSCIFMHIWKNSHTGTAGCTAMQEKNMLRILHWINAKEKPLLIQMPIADYQRLKRAYHLPEID